MRSLLRVVAAILITALFPLVASVWMSRTIIGRISDTAFHPEVGTALEGALGVYAELARTIKQSMRHEAEAIAAAAPLRAAATGGDRDRLAHELERAFAAHPTLVRLEVGGKDGEVLGVRARPTPVDAAVERVFTVQRALADDEAGAPLLVATFATPSARFEELEGAQDLVTSYRQIERNHRRSYLDDTYVGAFAVLLGITVLLAIAAGVSVVVPVTRGVARLVAATKQVGEGDLSVRVGVTGRGELADLGRSFNQMLEELEQSRARIEFLRRMGEWQKMARRLAHEIKNPLTPILLAVEECHRRYQGSDPEYRKVLETTHEVVEEEVGSLRRLVTEFSSFARLPRAQLAAGDLAEFLREQEGSLGPEVRAASGELHDDPGFPEIALRVPEGAMEAAFDREMLHRVLGNLVRNAAQAIRDARRGTPDAARGRVEVTAHGDATHHVVDVDDDGPGIDPGVGDAIFDPYVTTKRDGTGLGLSIVKKVMVDHGGTIDSGRSPLGGARFRLRFPRAGSAAAQAAVEAAAAASLAPEGPPSSSRSRVAPGAPLR